MFICNYNDCKNGKSKENMTCIVNKRKDNQWLSFVQREFIHFIITKYIIL